MAPPKEKTGLALDEVVVVVAAGAAADPKENVDPEVALVVAPEEADAGAAPPKLKAGAGFVVSGQVLVQVWSLTQLYSVAFLQSRIISDMCFYKHS